MFVNPLTERLADFIRSIGIDVRPAELNEPTFLPGIDVREGVIFVDEQKLTYPGDLLHEAGHIAIATPAERHAPKLTPTDAQEIAAQAWSWAALCHLKIAPEVVFHPGGYKGAANSLIELFSTGKTFGQPLLQYYGMTFVTSPADAEGVASFPNMVRWLR